MTLGFVGLEALQQEKNYALCNDYARAAYSELW